MNVYKPQVMQNRISPGKKNTEKNFKLMSKRILFLQNYTSLELQFNLHLIIETSSFNTDILSLCVIVLCRENILILSQNYSTRPKNNVLIKLLNSQYLPNDSLTINMYTDTENTSLCKNTLFYNEWWSLTSLDFRENQMISWLEICTNIVEGWKLDLLTFNLSRIPPIDCYYCIWYWFFLTINNSKLANFN